MDDVAGTTRDPVDELLARQLVEQGRLADVGPPQQRHPARAPARVGPLHGGPLRQDLQDRIKRQVRLRRDAVGTGEQR